jgi:hypothetical protein
MRSKDSTTTVSAADTTRDRTDSTMALMLDLNPT